MKDKIIDFFKENIVFIIIIIAIILTRLYIVTPVRVSGTSMDPTLKNGDIMLLNKTTKNIKRYEVVVVSKKFKGDELIKRVIGLPGDTVEVIDGIVYVNDKAIDDKFANGKTKDFEKITLSKEKDEYFVMGDNREVSLDSRILGPVSGKYIKGTSNIRLFPFNKIGNTLKK